MPVQVQKEAPDFTATAVVHEAFDEKFKLSDHRGRYVVLFFYPRDFSFVCPTELTSLSSRSTDFEQRNCRILGISVDGIEMHNEWLNTPAAESVTPVVLTTTVEGVAVNVMV